MPNNIKTAVTDRFLRYVTYETTSDPDSPSAPSTAGQTVFAEMLAKECAAIGLAGVVLSKHGVLFATLPANTDADLPVIGFIAHMDTSPDAPGGNVVPRVFPDYDGGDIILNGGTVISPDEFPGMKDYTGQTLITAGGDTLLGADNKAGIAIILTAMEYLIQNPDIPHGKVRIAFTPDEETGRGTENFDVAAFGADFAFTVDGGVAGELQYENFNAAKAVFTITGRSIHPGEAKGIMKNAALIAAEIISSFPPDEVPAKTEWYEGFYHLTKMDGSVEKASAEFIIRDFDADGFRARKAFAAEIAGRFNKKYGAGAVKLELSDTYYNMKEKITTAIIEHAKAAFAAAGVTPKIKPVRGGTDGALLSYKGLPCPNIFTGGHNFHGPYEFIPAESMEQAVNVLVQICARL